jgi:hypothetical protein
VQQQSPPAEPWKLLKGPLALVGRARRPKGRTRTGRNELTRNLSSGGPRKERRGEVRWGVARVHLSPPLTFRDFSLYPAMRRPSGSASLKFLLSSAFRCVFADSGSGQRRFESWPRKSSAAPGLALVPWSDADEPPLPGDKVAQHQPIAVAITYPASICWGMLRTRVPGFIEPCLPSRSSRSNRPGLAPRDQA